MRRGLDVMMERGGARPGEKTVLDALCPAVEALECHASEGLTQALAAAAVAAAEAGNGEGDGADGTADDEEDPGAPSPFRSILGSWHHLGKERR